MPAEVQRQSRPVDRRSLRILVIRAGRLGDTVWASTVLEGLQAHYCGEAAIDLLVYRGMSGLFYRDPRVQEVMEIRRRSFPAILSPTKHRIIRHSRRTPYTLAIDLETGTDFLDCLDRLEATRKIRARDILDPGARNHIVFQMRQVLEHCIPASTAQNAYPRLHAPGTTAIRERLGLRKDYLLLHPGNSQISRNRPSLRAWPVSHWRELAGMIRQRFPGLELLLLGERREHAHTESIAPGLSGIRNLCGTLTLPELLDLAAGARALLSSDTGPSHVAAALNTPVIALFGPTDPDFTGPWNSGSGQTRILRHSLPCSPCVHQPDFGRCAHQRCMRELFPVEALHALSEFIA